MRRMCEITKSFKLYFYHLSREVIKEKKKTHIETVIEKKGRLIVINDFLENVPLEAIAQYRSYTIFTRKYRQYQLIIIRIKC